MLRDWILGLFVAGAILTAAGRAADDTGGADLPAPDGAGPVSRAEVLEIARREIETRESWAQPYEMTAVPTETGWSVDVERTPAVPGGHRTIEISRAGEVEAYHRGR